MNGTPIELQRRTIAGEKVFPVWRLTGYRPTAVEDGHATGVLPSSAWFSNGGPSIYGGLLRVTSCNVDNAEGKRVAMATSAS